MMKQLFGLLILLSIFCMNDATNANFKKKLFKQKVDFNKLLAQKKLELMPHRRLIEIDNGFEHENNSNRFFTVRKVAGIAGLLTFFGLFICVVISIFRLGAKIGKEEYDHDRALLNNVKILNEEENINV